MYKIVFFRYLPLTEKVKEDFLMVELSRAGYIVEYWDITSMYEYSITDVEKYVPQNYENITVHEIHSKQELKYYISHNTDALFISLMTFEWKLIKIFHYFKKFQCSTAVFSYWPLPLLHGKNTKKIKAILFNYKRAKDAFLNKVFLPSAMHLGYFKTYDYCFKAGTQGWKGIGYIKIEQLRNIHFFEINNWDYDRFVSADLEIKKDPFIVFLDEYYPFHPDALLFGGTTVSYSQYYSDINKVFSAIEEKYGIPVVVAAHPKAMRYKDKNYFEGRKIYFNTTLELVSKASLVIAHDSLSICYAIICKKKIVFVNSNEIKNKLYENYLEICHLASFLNSPIVFADSIKLSDLPESFELDNKVKIIYDGMKKKYMSTLETKEKNVDLITKYIGCIFKQKNNDDNKKNIW